VTPTPSNLRTMKPGPRPDVITDAQFRMRIVALEQQLQQQNGIIQNMQMVLRQGEEAYRKLKGDTENVVIHLAALLKEKHGGKAYVTPAMLQETVESMQKGQFGGFDFETVGPDAVGPARERIAYTPFSEMQRIQNDRVAAARANAAPPVPEAPHDPEPCTGPWHKSLSAPGPACKKCGLSFPRGE
jgi:hypothetical protein